MADSHGHVSPIYLSENDYPVVGLCAHMLADDIQRVTGHEGIVRTAKTLKQLGKEPVIVAGTIGHSALIDQLIAEGKIDVSAIRGQWEASLITTIRPKKGKQTILAVVGSDRRGTAFGLTSLCRAIGVSPWYWWADVTPATKDALYVQDGSFVQDSPSVQYRGIFINDERFGGWAQWVEKHFDQETGKVGPKTYQRVFELLLRLRANYLWPAMHPGTQAFNADPENARLADQYAIVMGTSHCEQMLRNNEGEWKAVDEHARREGRVPPMGDFNYITNRETMQRYWEERVHTNGQYENTYTLGLRGIHDYPMEGANSTAERVHLMQQAINDQRDMLRRHIDKPIEEIPQVLCTYEEVLDAYHNGLQVPEDVIMLWSDDKQGYCRNLCNPEEMKRPGGAGIYYHLSYHGDPASWIWLSPLSPAFLSVELTKAYQYGAQKIWVFNVGDIKPAEKEISFVMDLAWDVEQWAPARAHTYIKMWAAETFGKEYADEIAGIQSDYYRLMATGKDSHVWFVEYPEKEIYERLEAWAMIAERADVLRTRIPAELQDAYFELVQYPVRGAQMLNEYQLMSRLSMRHATLGMEQAVAEGERVVMLYDSLNAWTRHYNEEIQDGKWRYFFSWTPYHWFYEDGIAAPYCTKEMFEKLRQAPSPTEVSVKEALQEKGALVMSDKNGQTDLWIRAISPVRNFSKQAEDNVICRVTCGQDDFLASATPINNVWHSPLIGPMWSKVGTIYLHQGENRICLTELTDGARIDSVYLGAYPPFPESPKQIIPAAGFSRKMENEAVSLCLVPGLGFCDGVTIQPLPAPSFCLSDAPCLTYDIQLTAGLQTIEVRTLPTLHIYEGRDARFAVQLDDEEAKVFSIHEGDFTSEWRKNVLRGYATRSVTANIEQSGKHTLRIYLLDPGIVLQEVCIY